MKTDVVLGIVYSKYDHVTGPDAFYWVPSEIPRNVLGVVSSKTLYLLSGEEGVIPLTLEIVSFPSIEYKGLIKYVKIHDPGARGGFTNASITLVFKDKDDTIFYKYKAAFEPCFEQFSRLVQDHETAGASPRDFLNTFNQFQQEIHDVLKDLFEQEVGLTSKVAFPDPADGQGKPARTFAYKLVVIGDPEVGKTSTILRFTDDAFRKTYIMTLGVNVSMKMVRRDDKRVKFSIWDIAGQSKFNLTRRLFYEGAHAQMLVFDLARPETLDSLLKWHADIKEALGQGVPGILLGNKADLVDEGTSMPVQARAATIARGLGMEYIETSALSGRNVNLAFERLVSLLLERGPGPADQT